MTRVTRALRLLREQRGLTRAFAQAHGPVHYGRGKRTGRSIKSAHTAALPAPPPRTTSLGETRALPDSSRLETFHSIVQLFARTIPPRRSDGIVRAYRRRVRRDRFFQNGDDLSFAGRLSTSTRYRRWQRESITYQFRWSRWKRDTVRHQPRYQTKSTRVKAPGQLGFGSRVFFPPLAAIAKIVSGNSNAGQCFLRSEKVERKSRQLRTLRACK